MGWASRWIRGLLGGGGGASGKKGTSSASGEPKPGREKKRWGFGKSFREKDPVRPPTPPVQRAATPRRNYASSDDGGDEQNKRAIAVAAATAAVAEAAVAAAQAAAAVVRLTSSGRCLPAGAKHEEWAAVRIQAAFRGYLAFVSVQSRARATRAIRSRQAAAHPGASTPEKYEQGAHDGAPRHGRSGSLKGGSAKTPGSDRLGRERSESCGRNWLDRWVEERYMDDEKNAKILEVDPGKPGRHASRRRSGGGNNHLQSSCSTRTSEQNSRSYATMPDTPSSPPSVGMGEALSPLRMPVDMAELYDSPQFFSATSRPGSSKRGGAMFTPTKSECARSLFGGYSDYPNYMANTESFRAKARSQSAPKQRPMMYEKSGSLRKASAHAFAPAGAAASLHAKFTNKAYPGSGRLDRLGMPVKY